MNTENASATAPVQPIVMRLPLTPGRVRGLFATAGIEVLRLWELPNAYWPKVERYEQLRRDSPWWLVKTRRGLIEVGWRKRVIAIDWSDTDVRKVVTEDDVTKEDSMVHAWSDEKALEYLKSLAVSLNA